jgi:saccharopine dehydrogenase-like NADP-dependent oxidoreductase
MGSAPGITNMLAAAACERLDTVESIELVDATIPSRDWSPDDPYAPPYAASTLIDEFTEPAPVFLEGKIELRPAGSGAKVYSFPEGEIECVYTIHSEPATLPRSYAAKGIRRVEWRLGLPAADSVRLRSFAAAGLTAREPVDVGGVLVAPRDVLAATLQRQPGAPPDPGAVERLRAYVVGTSGGERVEIIAEMVVTPPSDLEVDQGAYATGVPPSVAAQMLSRGDSFGPGVAGPEAMLPVEVFFGELASRGLLIELWDPRPAV